MALDLVQKYKDILSGANNLISNAGQNLQKGLSDLKQNPLGTGLVAKVARPIIDQVRNDLPSFNKTLSFYNQSQRNPVLAYKQMLANPQSLPTMGDIGKTAKLSLSAYGAVAAPAGVAIGAALPTAFKAATNAREGKTVFDSLPETFGKGLVDSAPYAGLFSATAPLTESLTSKIAPKLGGSLAERVVRGATKTGEGLVNTTALGGQYGPGQGALDFAAGALLPGNTKVGTAGKKFSLDRNTADELYKASEILNNPDKYVDSIGKFTNPIQRQTAINNMTRDAIEIVDRLAGKYLPDRILEKTAGNYQKTIKALVDLNSRNKLANIPNIGFVESDPEKILKSAKSEVTTSLSEKVSTAKQTMKNFYTDWVNRFQPVEDVVNALEKRGTKIESKADPRLMIKRLTGAGGAAELRQRQQLMPIIEELGNIPKADFDIFLKAKRDTELGKRGIFGSDSSLAESRINALSQKYDVNKLDAVATKLYEYQDKGLQMLRDNGFLNEQSYSTIKDANKNYVPFQRVMDEVDNYIGLPTAKAAQSSNPVQKIKGSERQIYSPLESIIANTYKVEAAISKNNVAKSLVKLTELDENLKGVFKQVAKAGTDTIPVWESGKKVFYTAPEDIIRSIKGLNEEGAGTLTKILSAPARLLRQGATGRNIDFMIPNMFKDQFDAAVNAKYGYTPFVDYIRGLGHLINFEKTGSDALVEGWINNGGKIFFENMGGRKDIARQISDATEKTTMLQKFGSFIFDGLDVIGKYSEEPTRLGLYKRALEATGDPLVAAAQSREGTLDFARMGAKMKTLNSLVPFMNVGVQGFDKLIRTAKENPKAFALRMGTYAVAPAAAVSTYNNLYHKQEYSEIPQYVKDTNFVLVTGRDDQDRPTYITFPKGNITPLMANPVDNFISYIAGSNPQSFGQLALNLLGDTLPIVQGGDNLGQIASRTLGANTPQFAKPAVEAVTNYNFFKNQPIVPEYMKNKPVDQQVKDSTPGAYQYIGNVLNTSPLQVQNFAEDTFAGFAKTTTNAIESFKSMSNGDPVDTNKIPVVRRFIGVGNTPEQTEKYKAYDQKDKELSDLQNADRPGFFERLIPTKEAGAADMTYAKDGARQFKDKTAAQYYVKGKKKEAVVGDSLIYPSGDSYKTIENVSNYYLYKDPETGDYKKVAKTVEIKTPKISGNDLIDIPNFNSLSSKLGSRKGDVVELFNAGLITSDQATKEITKFDAAQKLIQQIVKDLRAKSKVSSGTKVKATKLRSLNKPLPRIKVSKPKSVKQVKITSKRVNIAVPKSKKLTPRRVSIK